MCYLGRVKYPGQWKEAMGKGGVERRIGHMINGTGDVARGGYPVAGIPWQGAFASGLRLVSRTGETGVSVFEILIV